jgi:hypothetical protein
MTNGSRLGIVSSPRSVGGFHGVRACSGVFWALPPDEDITTSDTTTPSIEVQGPIT